MSITDPRTSNLPPTKPADNGKHPGGRPPLYDDPEQLQANINEYFAYCDNRVVTIVDKEGNPKTILSPAPYTMAGLNYYIGFNTRHGLANYEKIPEFSALSKGARLRVEADVERKLWEGGKPTGSIFWLKNHSGYSDKQEIEHGGTMNLTLTDAQLAMKLRSEERAETDAEDVEDLDVSTSVEKQGGAECGSDSTEGASAGKPNGGGLNQPKTEGNEEPDV